MKYSAQCRGPAVPPVSLQFKLVTWSHIYSLRLAMDFLELPADLALLFPERLFLGFFPNRLSLVPNIITFFRA